MGSCGGCSTHLLLASAWLQASPGGFAGENELQLPKDLNLKLLFVRCDVSLAQVHRDMCSTSSLCIELRRCQARERVQELLPCSAHVCGERSPWVCSCQKKTQIKSEMFSQKSPYLFPLSLTEAAEQKCVWSPPGFSHGALGLLKSLTSGFFITCNKMPLLIFNMQRARGKGLH